MKAEMERCAKHGTPRPETSAVRAHSPQAFWAFADSWQSQFHSGVVDHAIKDLCRVYISRTVKCEFCGNQRPEKATTAGLQQQYDQLLNFETSNLYDDRQKAALAYAEAFAWGSQDLDGLWARLHTHFSEQELVELGCCVALAFGQQSWIRLLAIDHHQYMAGTTASMAPGFETAEELALSKADPRYWAATSQA